MPECINCGEPLDGYEFPFGDYVECADCHTVMTTDWDYVAEDSLAWWVVGVAPDDAEPSKG